MKFQICTINKTIQIVDECKLIDFITQIKSMLPDWEDYTITSKMGEQFLNPIIIERWNPSLSPSTTPYWNYWYNTSGTFNIEIQ